MSEQFDLFLRENPEEKLLRLNAEYTKLVGVPLRVGKDSIEFLEQVLKSEENIRNEQNRTGAEDAESDERDSPYKYTPSPKKATTRRDFHVGR